MADKDIPSIETPPTEDHPSSPSPNLDSPAKPRRPVYEPTLLKGRRKRRRASPWVVIPVLLIFLIAILYGVLVLPKSQRFVATAGEMVYCSDQGSPGHPHLWIASVDGANPHRLTKREQDETSPTWSPSGSQIAFISAAKDGNPQIFMIDADGLNLVQVTQNSGAKSQPQFAPSNGRLIGFLSGGALNTVDVATGETQRILPVVTASDRAKSNDSSLTVSPTTSVSAFAWLPGSGRSQDGLAAVEDTGGTQELTLLPTLAGKPIEAHDNGAPLAAANNVSVAWSPDGGLLAVAMMGVPSPQPGHDVSALILLDSSGNMSGQHPLALFPSADLGPQNPIFTPDGARVVAEIWSGSDIATQHSVGLLSVPIDGSAQAEPLYKGAASNVRISQDGKTVYFVKTDAPAKSEICQIGIDGTGFKALTPDNADISGFALSPQSATGQ